MSMEEHPYRESSAPPCERNHPEPVPALWRQLMMGLVAAGSALGGIALGMSDPNDWLSPTHGGMIMSGLGVIAFLMFVPWAVTGLDRGPDVWGALRRAIFTESRYEKRLEMRDWAVLVTIIGGIGLVIGLICIPVYYFESRVPQQKCEDTCNAQGLPALEHVQVSGETVCRCRGPNGVASFYATGEVFKRGAH